jgi:dephospho-CoA kinase
MRVGLTGGVGSGATQAAKRLATKGVAVVSGDEAGHIALTFPEVQNSLRERFGQKIFTSEGEINRPTLGEIVFADAEALNELNRIVHPVLLDILTDEVRHLELQSGVVVVDAALLYEWGLSGFFHRMIVVEAPLEARLQRTMARDGLSEEQARQRLAAQWPLEKKIERADFVIHNGGTLEELYWQVDQVWITIEREAE